MKAIRRLLVSIPLFVSVALVAHGNAVAGQAIDPLTLNPPANPPYTCMATGSGAICRKDIPLGDAPGPSGVLCGSIQTPIELIVADTGSQEATRYYDTAGNLVHATHQNTYVGTYTNPVTGAYLLLDQVTRENIYFAVPGDLNSQTVTFTGSTRVYRPDGGIVVIDAGRDVVLPDGTTEQSSGIHPFDQYYGYGNTAALEPLCAAVGAPQTT